MAGRRFTSPDDPDLNAAETSVVRRTRGVSADAPPVVEDRYIERRTVAARDYTLARTARAVYFIFGLFETLIALRVALRLLAANPNSAFASLIYGITGPLVAPFRGLFRDPNMGGAVLEFSSLVAIVVYALIAYALVRLLYIFAD